MLERKGKSDDVPHPNVMGNDDWEQSLARYSREYHNCKGVGSRGRALIFSVIVGFSSDRGLLPFIQRNWGEGSDLDYSGCMVLFSDITSLGFLNAQR